MKIAIIVLALSLQLAACQQASNCSKGCMNCTSRQGCVQCFNSKLVPKWNPRGNFLSQRPDYYDCAAQESTDRCALYQLGGSAGQIQCSMCKPGYALNLQNYQCEDYQNKILNCVAAYIIGGSVQCQICNKSVPSVDKSKCARWNEPPTGKNANCEYSSLDGDQESYCVRCSQGYSSFYGYCVTTPSSVNGCMNIMKDGRSCESCNAFDGWYNLNKDIATCTKI